jgi:hypothetical protein
MSAAKETLKVVGLAVDALETIQGLTQIGGPAAAKSLGAIDKIVTALRDGLDGKISPQVTLSRIETITDELKADDVKEDAELAARFPVKP